MDFNFNGKKVLIRVDFNVPLDGEYNVTDDTRLRKAIPTIRQVISNGGAAILMSHLGRPQKKRNEDGSLNKEKYTLRHVVKTLSSLLGVEVQFSPDCVGDTAIINAKNVRAGEILLLENTRFHKEEAEGDSEFAARLAAHGDIYINDAFGTAHRAHASTTVIANYFKPEEKGLGILIQTELKNAKEILYSPKRPFVAIIGGAKVSDKIKVLDRLIEKVNHLVIGGGMAYTFIKAQGGEIGDSLFEESYVELAKELLEKARDNNVDIYLPEDSLIADAFSESATSKVCPSNEIPDGWMGLDIGPSAILKFSEVIKSAKTIFWNGPLGVFEMDPYSHGTFDIAKAVSEATDKGAYSIVGGGDSVSAINKSKLQETISFISTGGGAMMEYLEGKTLPGIKAITG